VLVSRKVHLLTCGLLSESAFSESSSEHTLVACQSPACQRCDRPGRLLEGVPVGARVFVAIACVQMSLLDYLTAKAIVGSKHHTCCSTAGAGDGASGKTGASKRGLKPVCGNRDLYNACQSVRDPQFVMTGGMQNCRAVIESFIPESTPSSYSTSLWYGALVGATGTPSIRGAGTLVGMYP
jgi:hypothetical protein